MIIGIIFFILVLTIKIRAFRRFRSSGRYTCFTTGALILVFSISLYSYLTHTLPGDFHDDDHMIGSTSPVISLIYVLLNAPNLCSFLFSTEYNSTLIHLIGFFILAGIIGIGVALDEFKGDPAREK